MIIFAALFMIISCICIEWYHAVIMRNYIENELTMALKVAVGLSMQDDYRKDHVSRINSDVAKNEFEKYLREVMLLDENYRRIENNEIIYEIKPDKMEIIEEPPSIYITGYIEKPLLIFRFPGRLTIPYSLKMINRRMEVEI